MKFQPVHRITFRTVLFNWDGTKQFVAEADRIIDSLGPVRVCAVHTLPHESIYSYVALCERGNRSNWLEENLRAKFREVTKGLSNFDSIEPMLLFGDKINELVRCANRIKADFLLTPPFEQSSFSKWIHGDLNVKLKSKANGKVVLLGSQTPALNFSREVEAPAET